MHLRVITPKKVVFEEEIISITAPAGGGEVTVLSHHAPFFTTLVEGIVKIETKDREEYLSVGGGYLETDGNVLHLLVSRAYGQDQVDEVEAQKAQERAQKLLKTVEDEHERQQILMELRKSTFDLKMLRKMRKRGLHN